MDKLHLEDEHRPLYLCHGKGPYGLDLFFSPDGDYFATDEVIKAVRSELDSLGFPVIAIAWGNELYTDRDSLRYSFDIGERLIPEELLNNIRIAVNVRCWAAGQAVYAYDQNDNPIVVATIQKGRIAPDHSTLELHQMRVIRAKDQLFFPAHDDMSDGEVGFVAELLGIFLQGPITSLGADPQDIVQVPEDHSRSESELFSVLATSHDEALTQEVPDTVHALRQLWDGNPPDDTV